MKRLSRWVPELALGALALALVGLLVAPWRERGLPAAGAEEPAAYPAAAVDPPVAGKPPATARELAALFGWREARPAPIPATAAPATPAEEAPWVLAIGYVVEQNGARSYLFKDTRARTVLSLRTGAENKGWKLVEVRERDFLLEFGGKPYIIKRKP